MYYDYQTLDLHSEYFNYSNNPVVFDSNNFYSLSEPTTLPFFSTATTTTTTTKLSQVSFPAPKPLHPSQSRKNKKPTSQQKKQSANNEESLFTQNENLNPNNQPEQQATQKSNNGNKPTLEIRKAISKKNNTPKITTPSASTTIQEESAIPPTKKRAPKKANIDQAKPQKPNNIPKSTDPLIRSIQESFPEFILSNPAINIDNASLVDIDNLVADLPSFYSSDMAKVMTNLVRSQEQQVCSHLKDYQSLNTPVNSLKNGVLDDFITLNPSYSNIKEMSLCQLQEKIKELDNAKGEYLTNHLEYQLSEEIEANKLELENQPQIQTNPVLAQPQNLTNNNNNNLFATKQINSTNQNQSTMNLEQPKQLQILESPVKQMRKVKFEIKKDSSPIRESPQNLKSDQTLSRQRLVSDQLFCVNPLESLVDEQAMNKFVSPYRCSKAQTQIENMILGNSSMSSQRQSLASLHKSVSPLSQNKTLTPQIAANRRTPMNLQASIQRDFTLEFNEDLMGSAMFKENGNIYHSAIGEFSNYLRSSKKRRTGPNTPSPISHLTSQQLNFNTAGMNGKDLCSTAHQSEQSNLGSRLHNFIADEDDYENFSTFSVNPFTVQSSSHADLYSTNHNSFAKQMQNSQAKSNKNQNSSISYQQISSYLRDIDDFTHSLFL